MAATDTILSGKEATVTEHTHVLHFASVPSVGEKRRQSVSNNMTMAFMILAAPSGTLTLLHGRNNPPPSR